MNLINLIHSIQPSFSSSNFCNSLPDEVELSLQNDNHFVYITFKDEILEAEVWYGDEEYDLSDDEIDYIYNYVEELLREEVEETRTYYIKNNYNFQDFSY